MKYALRTVVYGTAMPPERAIVHHLTELRSCPTVYPPITSTTVARGIDAMVPLRVEKSTVFTTRNTMTALSKSLIRPLVFIG
jgi:hypothetical protein